MRDHDSSIGNEVDHRAISHHSNFSDKSTKSDRSVSNPPTWEPMDTFSFPVGQIPVATRVRSDLIMDDFQDIMHIADGSNSNIYLAILNNERVIIKMLKPEAQNDAVAVHEFDVEHGMLARFNHPNIIGLLGAGRIPRKFIVLEWLGGGSLSNVLNEHQATLGLAKRLFRKPSFTYANLLSRARDIALALEYLHSSCHPNAVIIHRDLKPGELRSPPSQYISCTHCI